MVQRHKFLLSSLIVVCSYAQTITSPTNNQVVTGWAAAGNTNPFTFAISGAPTGTFKTCYSVDGYAVPNPSYGSPFASSDSGPFTFGCSTRAPLFQMPWDTYWVAPSTGHTVTATAYNVLGVSLGTSVAVPFTVGNTWPIVCADGTAPASTGSLGSPSGGSLPVTLTISGSCASDTNKTWWYIDGIDQAPVGGPGFNNAATYTVPFDTTKFGNGNHRVCITWNDLSRGPNIAGAVMNWAGEWCSLVNFSNTSAMETRLATSGTDCGGFGGAADCYMTPGSTATITPSVWNTDGTQGSANFSYFTSSTTLASLSVNNGSSVVVTAGAIPNPVSGSAGVGTPASATVSVMAETITGCTDLSTSSPNSGLYWSTCHPFYTSDVGRLIRITAGGGVSTPGVYMINSVNLRVPGITVVAQNGGGGISGCFPCSNLSFVTGPTTTSNIQDWTSNTAPCFGTDGRVHTSYSASCYYMHEMFGSASVPVSTGAPPYNWPGNLSVQGPMSEFDAGGLNTWEVAILPANTTCDQWQGHTLSNYQMSLSNYVGGFSSVYSNFKHAKYLYGIGDPVMRGSTYLWACAFGDPSQWTTPIIPTTISGWNAGSFPLIGINMQDEVNNPWGAHPLLGPVTTTTTNYWQLVSVASNGSGTCTVTGLPLDGSPGITMVGGGQGNAFVIHGSTSIGGALNTLMGQSFHVNTNVSGGTSTSFTYNCSGIPAGTYNDSGMTIEPFAADGYTDGGGTSYIASNAIANLIVQANTLGAPGLRTPITAAPATNGGCISVAGWGGNGVNGPISGISQFGEYSDFYPDNSNVSSFLMGRNPVNWMYHGSTSPGALITTRYGCYRPDLPLSSLVQAEAGIVGTQGYNPGTGANIASIADDVITLNVPHQLKNINPGDTRIFVQANSGSIFNTRYYITELVSDTQLRVATSLATDVNDTCPSGQGTITFSGGYVEPQHPTTIVASATLQSPKPQPASSNAEVYGQYFTLATPDSNLTRHIGEKFTVSCTGHTLFNGKTFVLATSNPAQPGYAVSYVFWESLSGTGTGGTATIQPDNAVECGRSACAGPNVSFDGENANQWDPRSMYENYIAAARSGAQGFRSYKIPGGQDIPYSYVQNQGYLTGLSTAFSTGINSGGLSNEFWEFPHYETAYSVPDYHANSEAARALTHWQQYLLQTKAGSPNYAGLMCTVRTGTLPLQGGASNALLCGNDRNGTVTQTIVTTPYLVTGQKFILDIIGADGTDVITTENAGTSSVSVTLQEGQAFVMIFPFRFAGSLNLPTVTARAADIPNTDHVVIRWAYDYYLFDVPLLNSVNCGTSFPCTLNADLYSDQTGNQVSLFYEIDYIASSGKILARSNIQKF